MSSSSYKDSIVTLYQSGLTLQAVGNKVGRSASGVLKILRSLGIPIRPKKGLLSSGKTITPSQELEIIEKFKLRTNRNKLAREYSCSTTTILNILKRNNIQGRRLWSECRTDNPLEHHCIDCQRVLPIEQFAKDKHSLTRRIRRCRDCQKYYQLNQTYGISRQEFDDMMAKAYGRCQICGENTSRLVLDHRHSDGVIRGILCDKCNKGLGCAFDSVDILESLVVYLEKSPTGLMASRKLADKCPTEQEAHRMRFYGVTPTDFIQLKQTYSGACWACKKLPTPTKKFPDLVVEHDHKTHEIRGLTCQHCNVAIGYFKDSPTLIKKAISYLGLS